LSNLCIDGLVFDQENMAAETRFARFHYGCDIGRGGHCPGGNRQRLIQGLAPDRLENDGFGPHATLEMLSLYCSRRRNNDECGMGCDLGSLIE
jgi:hypothetical protein